MSQNIQTVLLSLGTSLIVSLITFILGLRSGKNQTDRAKLQDIYKNLHSHFSTLKEALYNDSPKLWKHYEKNRQYLPLVKELQSTGDILFITKKIASQSIDLEKQTLDYSWNLNHHISDLHSQLVSNLELYRDGYSFKNYRNSENDNAHFESANPTECRVFYPREYYILYNKEKTSKLLKEALNSSHAVDFSLGNPMEYTFKIYPESLNVSIDDYIEQLFTSFENQIQDYNDLCNRKKELINEIDLLLKKIEKRVREPIGFWETIIGAFGDIFR